MTEATKMRSLLEGRRNLNEAEKLPLLAGCLTMAVNGQCGYMPPAPAFSLPRHSGPRLGGTGPIALPIEWVRSPQTCLPN
jgi:hypothetical protein